MICSKTLTERISDECNRACFKVSLKWVTWEKRTSQWQLSASLARQKISTLGWWSLWNWWALWSTEQQRGWPRSHVRGAVPSLALKHLCADPLLSKATCRDGGTWGPSRMLLHQDISALGSSEGPCNTSLSWGKDTSRDGHRPTDPRRKGIMHQTKGSPRLNLMQ